MTARRPKRSAHRALRGAVTIIITTIGSVRTPACNGV